MSIKFDECQITKIFTTSSLGVKASFDVINSNAVIIITFTIILSKKVTGWLEWYEWVRKLSHWFPNLAPLVLKRYQCVPKWSQKVTKWSQWVPKW